MKSSKEFENAIRNKKVPILVLDQKWHRLFAIHGKTDEIKEAEANLNALLARQGKLNNDLKEYKKLKNKLMDNIVQNMDGSNKEITDEQRQKNQDDDKRLIDELNQKTEAAEEELLEIPKQIKAENSTLMLLSMEYFYSKIRVNQEEAQEIDAWIKQVRVDLKKNIIKKQNREINNREIYNYLHDILGPEVLDLFDLQYANQSSKEQQEGSFALSCIWKRNETS